jgi:hypothetical protein
MSPTKNLSDCFGPADRQRILPATTLADVPVSVAAPADQSRSHFVTRSSRAEIRRRRHGPLHCELLCQVSRISRAIFNDPVTGVRIQQSGYLITRLLEKNRKVLAPWLNDAVLVPMGLTHTVTRTSAPTSSEFSWRHQWSGDSFLMMRPKQDTIMHAAGGMYSSASDIARWLQFNLRGSAPGIDASVFKLAQTAGPHLGLALEKNLSCDGYSLGQLACTYKNVRLTNQIGGYLGTRSIASYLPDCGVGVAFMVNSDSLTDGLVQNLTKLAIEFLLQDPSADGRAATLVEEYARSVASYPEHRAQQNAREDHNPSFGDWTWAPSPGDTTLACTEVTNTEKCQFN